MTGVSAQAHGVGDGWAVTQKANRRPVYEEVTTFGDAGPRSILVGWTYDDEPPSDDRWRAT